MCDMQSLDELFAEYAEFHDRWRQGADPDDLGDPIEVGSAEDVEYNHERQQIEATILAHPDSFDRVRCWMVDVHGGRMCMHQSDDEYEQECREMMDAFAERGPEAMDRLSELAGEVRKFVSRYAHITDAGAGCESWHFGAHCTHAEARALCTALYEQYAMEIDKGILWIERLGWSLGLVGSSVDAE